jgi:hypothetical protein
MGIGYPYLFHDKRVISPSRLESDLEGHGESDVEETYLGLMRWRAVPKMARNTNTTAAAT